MEKIFIQIVMITKVSDGIIVEKVYGTYYIQTGAQYSLFQ